jgi:PAS domain S-box-containing protein
MIKPTILCVDDETLVLASLRDALSQVLGDDFVVEIAESGEEALELIAELTQNQGEIPLIISDQLMPGLKGDQLLATVHTIYPKMLKVMLTGQATPEAIGHAVNAANLFRYIAKPWDNAVLSGVVREALSSYFQERNAAEINIILEKVNAELEQRITERTTALELSEKQFRQAFDNAPIGMSLVSLDGAFLRVNPAFCKIVGYSAEELLTQKFKDITHANDLETDQQMFDQLISGKTLTSSFEKRYIHKENRPIWISLNLSLVRNKSGDPLYAISQIVDISNRHEVDRVKNEFISIVSHELRTPLTAIRGALGMLETGVYNQQPAKANHMLQIALDNSDRLIRLVNDMLDLERLESGNVPIVLEYCTVDELLQQSIDAVQALAYQSTITLCCSSFPMKVWVQADSIIQTLTNLLSNAIKFSPIESTVWINVEEIEETDAQKPCLKFSVCDQGRGIPEDKLESIFGRFQQVDASDSRQKGGTGLGLAISRSIIHKHGGQIWAKSTLGKGSTFCFTLPLSGVDEKD